MSKDRKSKKEEVLVSRTKKNQLTTFESGKSSSIDTVAKRGLSMMETFRQNNVKIHETHDGLYYQDNKRKKEQVLAAPGIMVAKKPHSVTITIADPSASPKEIMCEKPFVPTQKMTGVFAGKKSQSEVSKARKKK